MSEKVIDVKFGTKTEALWTEVKKKTESMISGLEKEMEIQKGVLELCEIKIAEEEKKRKV